MFQSARCHRYAPAAVLAFHGRACMPGGDVTANAHRLCMRSSMPSSRMSFLGDCFLVCAAAQAAEGNGDAPSILVAEPLGEVGKVSLAVSIAYTADCAF